MIRTSIDDNARRLLAELDPAGRRLVTSDALYESLFGEDPDGGPVQGVALAVSRLRVMGHDVRMATHYVLPPRSRRPALDNPAYLRIVQAIEAGYAEASDLAAHLGMSSSQLIQAVSRMRSRARYQLETVRGYRLYPTSVGHDLAA